MKKISLVVFITLILSNCSFLPLQMQVASWAIDGVSIIATKKSLSDHGLSIITQKDCALWRGLTEGTVCRESLNFPVLAKQGNIRLSQLYLQII